MSAFNRFIMHQVPAKEAIRRFGGRHPRDTAYLEQVPTDTLKPLSGVVRTPTLIALSTIEETHIVPAALPDAAHA